MRTTIALAAALAAQLALQGAASGDVVVDAGGRFEQLLGVHVARRGVTFEVRGQGPGCTSKEHFHVERFGVDPVRLVLIRDVPSQGMIAGVCRRPVVVRQRIRFSLRELGLELGDRVAVINPVEISDLPVLRSR